MSTGSKQRPCAICGQDCTGREYVKDKKGRYFHQGKCVAEAKRRMSGGGGSAGHAASPPAAEIDPSMAAVLDEALSKIGDDCPNCGNPLSKGARVCLQCGFDTELGKSLSTKVERAPKERKTSKLGGSDLFTPTNVMLGVMIVPSALMSLGIVAEIFFVFGMLSLSVIGLGVTVWSFIGLIRDSIIQLVLCLIPFYFLYWILVRNEDHYLKGAWLGQTGATVVLIILTSGGFIELADDEAETASAVPAPYVASPVPEST